MAARAAKDTAQAAAEATAWVDAYLAALPEAQRTALQSLRETVASAAPGAVEAISYGIPAFRYRGRALVGYHAAKAHCALFPMAPAVIEAHREELEGFPTAKGTIRFTPERPLPPGLVRAIVRDRIVQIDRSESR
jgi:uncharacterized protein YdhG (YjbR/CyaY superfamily)